MARGLVALTLALGCGLAAVSAQELAAPEVPEAPDAPSTALPERPNLLVILLDDWGIDRFDGFPGQPDTTARTPVLDAFAADNLLFTRAYTDPLCSPSRAALVTGELGVHTGVRSVLTFYQVDDTGFVLDPAAVASLPARLGQLGYARFLVGKWHLTNEGFRPDPYAHAVAMGFERHVGVMANLGTAQGYSYRDYELVRVDAAGAAREQVKDGTYITTRQVDDALALIRGAGPRPWFTLLALSAPHQPWSRPPAELIAGDPEALDLDDGVAMYDATLEAADTEIGRLLRELGPKVLGETVVIVMGDNGTPGAAFGVSEGQARKKGFATDGGTHVPLIVSAPGLAPGTTSRLVHIVDLHATLLELAGGAPVTADSVSFAGALGDRFRDTPEREWVYASRRSPIGLRGVDKLHRRLLRTDRWVMALRSVNGSPPSPELRWHGDEQWGEGAEVDWDDPEVRRAWVRLRLLIDEVEDVPLEEALWRRARPGLADLIPSDGTP